MAWLLRQATGLGIVSRIFVLQPDHPAIGRKLLSCIIGKGIQSPAEISLTWAQDVDACPADLIFTAH